MDTGAFLPRARALWRACARARARATRAARPLAQASLRAPAPAPAPVPARSNLEACHQLMQKDLLGTRRFAVVRDDFDKNQVGRVAAWAHD